MTKNGNLEKDRRMRILFIGDIVGRPGRDIITEDLSRIKRKEKIDVVIANAENSASGSGVTPRITQELLDAGVNILTSGDHIWKRREIYEFLESTDILLRPLNYPDSVPGRGSTVVDIPGVGKVGVINIVGRVFMDAVDCPFQVVRSEVKRLQNETDVIIVDVHAEATSEKIAMGWYLDGEVSAVIGTHTHIQTADERILPEGTAYITDCGMTGPYDSVIGRKKEPVLTRFLTHLPARFDVAEGDVQLHGVIVEINSETGKAIEIKRIQHKEGK